MKLTKTATKAIDDTLTLISTVTGGVSKCAKHGFDMLDSSMVISKMSDKKDAIKEIENIRVECECKDLNELQDLFRSHDAMMKEFG